MPHGTPRNTAQHVAASLVAGNHPVDNQKTHGAYVIGDDLQRIVA